jgi:uncharacterized membrane protein
MLNVSITNDTEGELYTRLLGNFLRDRHTQIVLSVFVATFAYCTAGLYTVGISGGSRVEEFPRLAVTGAILLLFACLGFLIYFIDHLAHSIQLDTIMDVVQQNTSLVIADLPDTGETGALAAPAQAMPILAWRSGYIQSVHPEDLYEAAKAAEVVINLVPRVGDFVVEDMPIAWWWADESAHAGARVTERLGEHLIAVVLVGSERTLLQDAAFGMRQLVDIALKALSPAINDPYTAVMSVERHCLPPWRRAGSVTSFCTIPMAHRVWSPAFRRSPTMSTLRSPKSGATALASRRSLTHYCGCFR